MVNVKYQSGIFDKQTHVIQLEDADLEYHSELVNQEIAEKWYQRLRDDTDWQQDTITVYGKPYLTPRLTSWVGEPWMSYRYSNHTMTPIPWSADLLKIKTVVEAATKHRFNSVLVNYYRDGKDSNGWHSDDEPELGELPVIASLSLGASRDFQMRHKTKRTLKHSIALASGSLLVMRGTTQQCWQHHVPKRAHAKGRINLTFRSIIQPASK